MNKKNRKVVITYGTFDMIHIGHMNLLKRAKQLGDYLIVGITSENYDRNRGKLNVHQNLIERIENVKKTGLADKIIIEEYEGQKIVDIQKYNVDIFAIGSDWKGKFDYLKEYCKVVYLERTKGISSTQLRNKHFGIIKLGIVGYGRIAKRFVSESKFVSGVNIEGVFGPNEGKAKKFAKEHELLFATTDFNEFLNKVDAVYIASPHHTHYYYSKLSLLNDKHVLCEKPLTLSENEAIELYELADKKGLTFIEAIKTAYSPGFQNLVNIVKSGIIGKIKNIDATFTKLVSGNIRELDPTLYGGSVTELVSYPLLAFVKILGINPVNITFYSAFDKEKGVDIFTKINLVYNSAIVTAKVGLGVKSEGDLIISGTKGYIYVPAPWWKTEYFEVRGENSEVIRKFVERFDGDGLRYELAEFVQLINNKKSISFKLKPQESITICKVIEKFLKKENLILI